MIFTIFLHRQAQQEFESHWNDEAKRRGRHLERSFTHRYNDIAAFAEIYWDWRGQILIDYYIRGDRRTRLGKDLDVLASAKQFYYRTSDKVNMYPARNPSEKVKRKAVNDSLNHVERLAENQKWFVDLAHERHLLAALSLKKLFAVPPT